MTPGERIRAAVKAAGDEFRDKVLKMDSERWPYPAPEFITEPAWRDAVERELDSLAERLPK